MYFRKGYHSEKAAALFYNQEIARLSKEIFNLHYLEDYQGEV